MNAVIFAFAGNASDATRHFPLHMAAITFDFKHLNNFGRAVVAEQLAKGFFMKLNAVLFDQLDKIMRAVTGQGGAAEVRILREEIFRLGAEVGKVAAPATGDTNFFAELVIVIDEQYPFATLPGHPCTHHAGSTRTDDDDIVMRTQRVTAK